jgi:hypothetical protein
LRRADRDAYRLLTNGRGKVNERYEDAIFLVARAAEDEEVRRFELMHRNLSPVRSEKQLLADALVRRLTPMCEMISRTGCAS